jgi:hypothetical protein
MLSVVNIEIEYPYLSKSDANPDLRALTPPNMKADTLMVAKHGSSSYMLSTFRLNLDSILDTEDFERR